MSSYQGVIQKLRNAAMVGRSRPICDKALRKIHRLVGKNLLCYVTHRKKFQQALLSKLKGRCWC